MTSRRLPSASLLATLASATIALAGCGSRTQLYAFEDGAPSRFDAGPVTRPDAGRPLDAGVDAARVGCTSDGDCPDDGLMCNGFSFCNPMSRVCETVIPERCDDGIGCTADRCVEGRGCVFEPSPGACPPGSVCDPMLDCIGMCSPVSDLEVRCRDGVDDDCDGLPDCADPDCRGSVECSMCAPRELFCSDGNDEDCDGLPDCSDPDCAPDPVCGMTCVPTERSERTCFDGLDNDCNGLFDCMDRTCAMDPSCGVCMPIADREIFCGDGRDDDCDGAPDCMDPDCARSPECGACGPVSMTEVFCSDGRDDDCDGAPDCADRDCAGNPECGCVPSSRSEGRCRDGLDDDCDGRIDCDDRDCSARPICMTMCTPTAANELGVGACTNGLDDDCDGRTDCTDPDCSPFGPMGECCDGEDNNGDGNVDEFTCRCFEDSQCAGVGTLDQTCWQETFSICAPRCNLYGGDRFCREGFMLDRCDRATGECL